MWTQRIALLHTGFSECDLDTAHRLCIAATRLGLDAEVFDKSEDIVAYAPDFVIALSAQDAKLTSFPTYGIVDQPVATYERAIRFVRNIMTYDGWLTASRDLRLWIEDIAFGAHKQTPKIAFFARTAQMTDFVTTIARDSMIAAHVDESSSQILREVLAKLSHTRALKAYGNSKYCTGMDSQAYFGIVEADGQQMVERYRNTGVALAISDDAQQKDGAPSAELFKAIAGGAIVICNRIRWTEDAFGDSVLYVNSNQSSGPLAAEILERLQWIRDNPEIATRKAFEAHSLLQKHYSAERLLMNVLELHRAVLVDRGYQAALNEDAQDLPKVSYIMRTGGGGNRPIEYVRRALDSLVAQRYPNLAVIFVLHAPFPALEQLMRDYPTLEHRYVRAFGCMRSTAILHGVRAVQSGLFGLLDDDDEFHPNHVRMLVKTLKYHNERDLRGTIGVAYSASVEVTSRGHREERSEWTDRYMLLRKQRHCIEHFRWYTSSAMAEYRFFLMSNSWLARREIVNDDILTDPLIDTCEDLYFCIQLAQRSHFAFSCEVTAIHHFHGQGHSTFLDSGKHWPDTQRIARRAWRRVFPSQQIYHNPGFSLIREIIDDALPLGSNLLGRMTSRAEAEARGDIVHFNKYVPTGIALYGPYAPLVTGRYKASMFIEFADLDSDADAGLRLDVAFDDGEDIVAVKDIPAKVLRRLGRFTRIEISFDVPHQSANKKLELRLWRQTELTVDVVRVVIGQRSVDEEPDSNAVADVADEKQLPSSSGQAGDRKHLSSTERQVGSRLFQGWSVKPLLERLKLPN